MIVRPAPADHLQWIVQRAGVVPSASLGALEAVDESGNIRGMVAFDGWMPNACNLHVALDTPIALRPLMRRAFRTAFLPPERKGLGKGVARAMVLGTNKKSIRLIEHLGFKFAYRSVNGWDVGVDYLLYEMRRDECRWLGGE